MWRKQNSGMTLIEVLLVIGLVLALSVVVHRGLSKQRETAIVKTVTGLVQTEIKDLIIETYIALQEANGAVYVAPDVVEKKLREAVNAETKSWKIEIELNFIDYKPDSFPLIQIKPVGWDDNVLKQNKQQLQIDLNRELLADDKKLLTD